MMKLCKLIRGGIIVGLLIVILIKMFFFLKGIKFSFFEIRKNILIFRYRSVCWLVFYNSVL